MIFFELNFKHFFIESQTINQFLNNKKNIPPQVVKEIYNTISGFLVQQPVFKTTHGDRLLYQYVKYFTYWGIMDYIKNSITGSGNVSWTAINGLPSIDPKTYEILFGQNVLTDKPNSLYDHTSRLPGSALNRTRAWWNEFGDFIVTHIHDKNIQSKFSTIDYSLSDLEQDNINWHKALAVKASGEGGKGRIILNLNNLGKRWYNWNWLSLDRGFCRDEANAAGHCGNAGAKEGDNILSLRDPENKVHLTFIVNNEILGEMKGRGNDKPSPKYHEPIVALLKSNYVGAIRGGGYEPEGNFEFKDLDEKTQKALLKDKVNINDPFGHAISGAKDDKDLKDRINSALNSDAVENIVDENGKKVLIVRYFEGIEDIYNTIVSWPNVNVEDFSKIDEPWEMFDSSWVYENQHVVSDAVQELNKENINKVEKYLDSLQDEYDFDEDADLEDKISQVDELESILKQSYADGYESGSASEMVKNIFKQLSSIDGNGFYFKLTEPYVDKASGKTHDQWLEKPELRISMPHLKQVVNAVDNYDLSDDYDYDFITSHVSTEYDGYNSFDKEHFNDSFSDRLHEIDESMEAED